MRRVVVTGLGIVSSIGNNADEVTASLRDARSGISFSQDFAGLGGDTEYIETTALALAETKIMNEEVTVRAILEGGDQDPWSTKGGGWRSGSAWSRRPRTSRSLGTAARRGRAGRRGAGRRSIGSARRSAT